MGWLEQDGAVRDERYLRLPDPGDVKQSTKAVIRFIDEKPREVWRHWVGNRPFNCPGKFQGCPICKVREAAVARNAEEGRKTYRMDRKWLINVLLIAFINEENEVQTLEEPEVKIYSFGKEMGESLELYIKEFGDLRGYDVKIIKTKTGLSRFDVKYSLLKGNEYELSKDQKAVAENNLHDISEEIKPAAISVLQQALNGGFSASDDDSVGNDSPFASLAEVIDVKSIASDKGYNLSDFFPGVKESEYPTEELEKVKVKLGRL